jgi:hypothetical protein
MKDRAIAQAVSRWLPTAATRVRAKVISCGICGGKSGTGAGFLRVLRFPLPILIPPTAPHSWSIIQGWYNRPVSGRRAKWAQSHPPQETKKILASRKGRCGSYVTKCYSEDKVGGGEFLYKKWLEFHENLPYRSKIICTNKSYFRCVIKYLFKCKLKNRVK